MVEECLQVVRRLNMPPKMCLSVMPEYPRASVSEKPCCLVSQQHGFLVIKQILERASEPLCLVWPGKFTLGQAHVSQRYAAQVDPLVLGGPEFLLRGPRKRLDQGPYKPVTMGAPVCPHGNMIVKPRPPRIPVGEAEQGPLSRIARRVGNIDLVYSRVDNLVNKGIVNINMDVLVERDFNVADKACGLSGSRVAGFVCHPKQIDRLRRGRPDLGRLLLGILNVLYRGLG